jgi:hypothetical protein
VDSKIFQVRKATWPTRREQMLSKNVAGHSLTIFEIIVAVQKLGERNGISRGKCVQLTSFAWRFYN